MMKRCLLSRSFRRHRQGSFASKGFDLLRFLSSSGQPTSDQEGGEKVFIKYSSSGLPDFIEEWDRHKFRKVGYGLAAITAASVCNTVMIFEEQTVFFTAGFGALTASYWIIGKRDMEQRSQTIRRNFPVLGNMRYLLEMIRPEIRQYVSSIMT